MVEGSAQHIADRLALFERAVLVEIASRDVSAPLYLSLVRLELAGDYIQERGLSLAICADKSDVLAFKKAERSVIEYLSRTESVRYVFNIKYAHFYPPVIIL